MSIIIILTVVNVNEEDYNNWYFSTEEKAIKFIENNFKNDNPIKISNGLFQGKRNNYIINSQMIDQERI